MAARKATPSPTPAASAAPTPTGTPAPSLQIESLLLTAARIGTFDGKRGLTNASGFFFERADRLFLVTSRHVMIDEPSKPFPHRIEIEVHLVQHNLAASAGLSTTRARPGTSP